jgi:hypothetical protein
MNEPRTTLPANHQGNHVGNHHSPAGPHAPHAPHPSQAPGIPQASRAVIMPQAKVTEEDTAPIELIADVEEAPGPSKKIRAFGVGEHLQQKNYTRAVYANRTGAVRVKTFHGKLSDQGMEYLDNAINDWLEAHPDFEVKFVTSSVGMFDGKIKEPAEDLNVWY